MEAKDADAIVSELWVIIMGIAPEAVSKPMYGGTVSVVDSGKKERLFAGIFVRKDFVTLELDGGPRLIDESGILGGEGKTRRYIRFSVLADMKRKKFSSFVCSRTD